MTAPAARRRIVVVTGMAGAGLSTARTAFEDIGFEAIDNLPLSLAEQLINSPDASRPLAFGIDVRTRGRKPAAVPRWRRSARLPMVWRWSASCCSPSRREPIS